MKRAVFVDKVSKMQLLSMKRAVFMDKVSKMQLLSMKRGVFMDKVGEGGSSVCRRHVRDM